MTEKTELKKILNDYYINELYCSEIDIKTKKTITKMLLDSEGINSFFSNHIEYMQNLLEWSERNNKKLFYSKEHKLLYIEDGVYNKTENQIKKIGGFRLLKTKDQKNDFIYGYKSNIITDYSYECIMFIKEEIFKTLNPKLKRFSNEIDNADFIKKINLINDIFNIDVINNEIKEIQQKLDTKNVEENEKTKKALDRIIDTVFSIYSDIKIGFLNSMVMNALNGNFNELDKVTEKEIKIISRNENFSHMLITWAAHMRMRTSFVVGKEIDANISLFCKDYETSLVRLTKLMNFFAHESSFDRLGYEEYDEMFGKPIDTFFKSWLRESPETLTTEFIKTKIDMAYIYSKSTKYIWEVERNKFMKEQTLENSGLIMSIKETEKHINFKLNKDFLLYFIGNSIDEAKKKLDLLISLYRYEDWDGYTKTSSNKEIKLRIKKELILEGIDNYTLLYIIINNAYEFNKRKEFKEMLQNMQRAIVLNKKLSIQEEFKDKRYKQKI